MPWEAAIHTTQANLISNINSEASEDSKSVLRSRRHENKPTPRFNGDDLGFARRCGRRPGRGRASE